MKILIITLYLFEENQIEYFNPQSIGLGRALAEQGHEVSVYSFERMNGQASTDTTLMKGLTHHQVPAKGLGHNVLGITDCLDPDFDMALCFSDIQLSYKRLFLWCQKYKIPLYPYVGAIRSRQDKMLKRLLMDRIAERNLRLYRKQLVFAKTTDVQKQLKSNSVNAALATVGLDITCTHKLLGEKDLLSVKKEFNYRPKDTVLLFVGRMVNEKRPLEMLDIFNELHQSNPDYKLIMIGQGDLKSKVANKIKTLKLNDSIKMVDIVPNNQMWKYYNTSSFYINLNIGEIFGMAILEAMYYKCHVVARRAPGPDIIITNGHDGHICDNNSEIIQAINKGIDPLLAEKAHEKIVREFTWGNTAKVILNSIKKYEGRRK
jgi:1,2-diacylglycerol 3-alpha-glucosyltransferase